MMSRSMIPAAYICLILSLVFSTASAQMHEFKDQKQALGVELPYGHKPQYGFQLIRLTASNMGREKATWKINLNEHSQHYGRAQINQAEQEVIINVDPGVSVQRDLLIALGNINPDLSGGIWNTLEVEVTKPSGLRDSWASRCELSYYSGAFSGIGYDLHMTRPKLYGYGANVFIDSEINEEISGIFDCSKASADWRAYSAYEAVILTGKDWEDMSAEARMAIGEWVRLGGHLQFVQSNPNNALKSDIAGGITYGYGEIHSNIDSENDQKSDSEQWIQNYPLIDSLENKPLNNTLNKLQKKPIFHAWLKDKQPSLLRDQFTIWPVILVLVAFFVMVTPVNLFLLAPNRKRHRLFKTIPLISITACIALAIAVIMGDGIGGDGQRVVLIECSPESENRHYIEQWQASHCGAIFGGRFSLEDSAYIEMLSNDPGEMSLNIGSDKIEAGGGWFTSRSTQTHLLKAARSSRGRLEWTDHAGQVPSVVSTFDFPLRDLYIRSQNGNWWHAPSLDKGKTTVLVSVDEAVAHDEIDKLIEKTPQEERTRNLSRRNGHFIAFTDAPPAIESLSSIDWNDMGIITGLLAQP